MKKSSLKLTNVNAIFYLINKYFFKSIIGPLSAILLPILFMVIYLVIAKTKNNFEQFSNGLSSYLTLSILPLCLLTIPALNTELRNSILLRKIKTSNINSYQYIFIINAYFFCMSIIAILLVFIIFLIIMSSHMSLLNNINFGGVIFGLFLLIISSIAFGNLLSTYTKSTLNAQVLGICLILVTLTFSGQFIPLQVIGSVRAISYMGLLSPSSYAANLLNIATYNLSTFVENNNIFNIYETFKILTFSSSNVSGAIVKPNIITVYDSWQKVLYLLMPFVLFIGFNLISARFFKWSNR